jgi:4-amino-4-deoxy-L-arabinose transferase
MMNSALEMSLSAKLMLAAWLLAILTTILLFKRKSPWWPLALFVSGFCLASAFALFHPFLHAWDEQFHALVAKNALSDPFRPKLYPENPLGKVSEHWTSANTWLHKQPLFTWMMAFSMKCFGANLYALRLPSILLFSLMPLALYRMVKINYNRLGGFMSALLLLHSAYMLGLVSGKIGTDHNDIVFSAFVLFSFWSLAEWHDSEKTRWLYFIGLFVAGAVLTKWLVGLLVFFGWGCLLLYKLLFDKTLPKKHGASLRAFLKALAVAIVLVVPWQVYTFWRFPALAHIEMRYNSQHVWESLENHIGNAWFHFDQVEKLYFHSVDFWVIFGICFLLFLRSIGSSTYKWMALLSIAVVYVFFTLVQTKMPSFTVPVMPLVLSVMGIGMAELISFMQKSYIRWAMVVILPLLFINLTLKPQKTLGEYGFKSNGAEGTMYARLNEQAKRMKAATGTKKRVVFGMEWEDFNHISWMYFTNDLAYPVFPSMHEVGNWQKNGWKVAILAKKKELPLWLKNDPKIEIIKWN